MPNNTPARIAWRYLVGRPLDGVDRTDATYLSPATRALAPSGRASRWARLPGWQRQAVRVGPPVTASAVAFAHHVAPTYTTASLALLAALGTGYGARRTYRGITMRRFNAVYIRPTRQTLMAGLGCSVDLRVDPTLGNLVPRLAKPLSPAEQAMRAWYGAHVEPVVRWLPERVQRGVWAVQKFTEPARAQFRRPVEQVGPSIRLVVGAPYLSADDKKLVSSVVKGKIPVGDMVEQWDMVGPRTSAVWTVRRQPPAKVGLDDVAPHFDTIAEDEFVIGLTTGSAPFVVSLADDAPHIAISGGSGAGKSVLVQLVAAQVLRRGGQVTIIDIKGSHRWAKGVPGVRYCITGEQAHNALVELAELAGQRNRDAFNSDDDDFDPGIRHLVIMEEVNAGISILMNYWLGARLKGDPVMSPAIVGLRFLLFTGRSAKVNVVGIAQSLTARAIGGPEARENFAVRCLARYTANAWKMLAPQAAMPRASRVRGRWTVVIGDTVTQVQVAYLTPAQMRDAARVTGGAKIPDTRLTSSVAGNDPGTGNTVDPLSEPITLREAVEEGILPWGKDATKMRMSRARKAGRALPEPVGKRGLQADLYRRGDLIIWAESEKVA
jgi:hypothetical protein